MRVLVVAETSCASRNAFETVMTETPARSAMSLRRIIGCSSSKRRSTPVKFPPQCFAKGSSGQVYQTHGSAAAPNRDPVARKHLAQNLPISAQNGCQSRRDNTDLDGRGERKDQRAVGERVRANRCQRERLGRRKNNRSSRR